ncbi:hypothetical protein V6N11_033398 [Hibiscus sabdariffa]|uniref:Protein kinase domain-containing protein n=1 Tax=Hibiscus sabdariffa TaxID=183260 RepID=A0ABR2PY00_9ROSI
MEWGRQQKKPPILLKHRSVDKRILDIMLSWDERVKVLKDVASAVWYLHQGWEAKVLHRDIKASNVILDKDTNARLGQAQNLELQNLAPKHLLLSV